MRSNSWIPLSFFLLIVSILLKIIILSPPSQTSWSSLREVNSWSLRPSINESSINYWMYVTQSCSSFLVSTLFFGEFLRFLLISWILYHLNHTLHHLLRPVSSALHVPPRPSSTTPSKQAVKPSGFISILWCEYRNCGSFGSLCISSYESIQLLEPSAANLSLVPPSDPQSDLEEYFVFNGHFTLFERPPSTLLLKTGVSELYGAILTVHICGTKSSIWYLFSLPIVCI